MSLPSSLEEMEPIFRFVGYGNPGGSVWFIGSEEAGGRATLNKRLNFKRYEDLREAHVEKLNVSKHHDEKEAIDIQDTWEGMCHVMLGLNEIEVTKQNLGKYQARYLGRKASETLLTELNPLPNTGETKWDYKDLGIPQLEDRATFERMFLPKWRERLERLIDTHQPKLVIAYGSKVGRDGLEPMYGKERFEDRGPFRFLKLENTLIVCCGHFVYRYKKPRNMKSFENREALVRFIKDAGYVHARKSLNLSDEFKDVD